MAYTKEYRQKNKSILLATLNYLLENHSRDMVFDDYSPSRQWYLQELKQTELDIKHSRSAQIKNRLDRHLLMLREKYDTVINRYIKEKTGYDIDIFDEYKINAQHIISKGSLSGNDVYLVEKYLKAYATITEEQKNIAFLKTLLTERKAYFADLLSDEDGFTESFHYVDIIQGKKSLTVKAEDYEQFSKELHKDWLIAEEEAPNGVDKLNVQFSGKGEDAITYVVILLKAGSGTLYSAIGEKLPIKAYWKDSNVIVIETKAEYEYHNKYMQVSSYGEVFNIEYRFF